MSTLPTMDQKAEEQTIASWKVTPPTGGLWSEYSVTVTTFNNAGQIDGTFVYLDDVQASIFGVEPGWFTYESVMNWDPISADDTVIPYGVGVQIGSDCGATVTFAGQVVAENTDIAVNAEDVGGFTWTGNVSPVDLKLNDFAVTPPAGGLWSEYSVTVTTFNKGGQIEGTFVYLDEVQSSIFGVVPGWYTYESVMNWDPVDAGETLVIAGEMFQIGSDCGGVITIPSAL